MIDIYYGTTSTTTTSVSTTCSSTPPAAGTFLFDCKTQEQNADKPRRTWWTTSSQIEASSCLMSAYHSSNVWSPLETFPKTKIWDWKHCWLRFHFWIDSRLPVVALLLVDPSCCKSWQLIVVVLLNSRHILVEMNWTVQKYFCFCSLGEIRFRLVTWGRFVLTWHARMSGGRIQLGLWESRLMLAHYCFHWWLYRWLTSTSETTCIGIDRVKVPGCTTILYLHYAPVFWEIICGGTVNSTSKRVE